MKVQMLDGDKVVRTLTGLDYAHFQVVGSDQVLAVRTEDDIIQILARKTDKVWTTDGVTFTSFNFGS